MPLCGIISSESLGMLPAVWAKECENLLEVTVVTGCDTQLERRTPRGPADRQGGCRVPPWRGQQTGSRPAPPPEMGARGAIGGTPTNPRHRGGSLRMMNVRKKKLLKPNITSELINAKIKL